MVPRLSVCADVQKVDRSKLCQTEVIQISNYTNLVVVCILQVLTASAESSYCKNTYYSCTYYSHTFMKMKTHIKILEVVFFPRFPQHDQLIKIN